MPQPRIIDSTRTYEPEVLVRLVHQGLNSSPAQYGSADQGIKFSSSRVRDNAQTPEMVAAFAAAAATVTRPAKQKRQPDVAAEVSQTPALYMHIVYTIYTYIYYILYT